MRCHGNFRCPAPLDDEDAVLSGDIAKGNGFVIELTRRSPWARTIRVASTLALTCNRRQRRWLWISGRQATENSVRPTSTMPSKGNGQGRLKQPEAVDGLYGSGLQGCPGHCGVEGLAPDQHRPLLAEVDGGGDHIALGAGGGLKRGEDCVAAGFERKAGGLGACQWGC